MALSMPQAFPEVKVTLKNSFVSQYIWRGQDLYPKRNSATQPSLDANFTKLPGDICLDLNLWGSFANRKGFQDINELDYAVSLSKTFSNNISVSLGETYYDYYNTHRFADSNENWASMTLPLPQEFNFNLFGAYDYPVAEEGPNRGFYGSWGVSRDVPLPKTFITQTDQVLSCSIVNWGSDGPYDLKPSLLYATEFNVATCYNFDKVSVGFGIHYVVNYDKDINNGNHYLWGGLDLAYTF
jgi:hypothetical protein